jgi:hypothetical protein
LKANADAFFASGAAFTVSADAFSVIDSALIGSDVFLVAGRGTLQAGQIGFRAGAGAVWADGHGVRCCRGVLPWHSAGPALYGARRYAGGELPCTASGLRCALTALLRLSLLVIARPLRSTQSVPIDYLPPASGMPWRAIIRMRSGTCNQAIGACRERAR